MLALTFTTSTFVCIAGVYSHLLPVKMHYSCLALLLPYIDLLLLTGIPMALLHLLGPFDTHICIRFLAPFSRLTNSMSIYIFMFSLLLLKGLWLQNSCTETYIIHHKWISWLLFCVLEFTFLPCRHLRQLPGARQFLLGMHNYLSDLSSYVCSIKKSALYEDQRTALFYYVAAKTVLMKVLELSVNFGIGTSALELELILQTPLFTVPSEPRKT